MSQFDKFMSDIKGRAQQALDTDSSSVEEEVARLDFQLQEIAVMLAGIETCDQAGRLNTVERIRRRLNAAMTRSYRARQITRGARVPKS